MSKTAALRISGAVLGFLFQIPAFQKWYDGLGELERTALRHDLADIIREAY